MSMTRSDFQRLAGVRIEEARILLANQAWDGAYYLAGYAVECALKACIAKLTMAEDFPDKKLAERSWKHDLNELIDVAGLEALRKIDAPRGSPRDFNWKTVKDWNEQSRYGRKTQSEAESLYNAITGTTDGVLPWIKRHW